MKLETRNKPQMPTASAPSPLYPRLPCILPQLSQTSVSPSVSIPLTNFLIRFSSIVCVHVQVMSAAVALPFCRRGKLCQRLTRAAKREQKFTNKSQRGEERDVQSVAGDKRTYTQNGTVTGFPISHI